MDQDARHGDVIGVIKNSSSAVEGVEKEERVEGHRELGRSGKAFGKGGVADLL